MQMPALQRVLSCLFAAVAAVAALPAGAQTPAPRWSDFMPQPPLPGRPELDGRGLVVAVLDTGVDPLASGLQKTSAGAVKVLEARDFSGQGDVELAEVRVTGERTATVDGQTLRGLPAPAGEAWLGWFAESQIGPAELRDLNRNGQRNDKLALLVWRTGPGPDDTAFALDLDGNGDFAGERVVRPYHVAQELIALQGGRPDRDLALLSLAAEVDWRKQTAQLHFCDGSHGTHVAGIIAGYRMFGQDGWDGVAPGAQVLSLKIGHNARSGGATPSGAFAAALEFAGAWSSRHNRPVVLNASYGVGSGTEAQSAIDRLTDDVIRRHPLLTVAYSAGNSGPGVSTVGTPAGADLALAVGAVLPKASAAALYGGALQQDELFAFSSRGAELAKPEVVAPGAAAASVPIWDDGEIKQGTSMASPQVAGAMLRVWAALLYQPGRAPNDPLTAGWHSGLVRRAIQTTARPLAGYTALDQGSGMVDLPSAAARVVELAKKTAHAPLLGLRFRGQTAGQSQPTPALFLRNGAPGPVDLQTANWKISAVLAAAMPETAREQFSLPIRLRSTASWVQLKRPDVLLRGERPSSVELALALPPGTKPGLHVAEVLAEHEGVVLGRSHVAVVVPHKFAADGQPLRFAGVQLPAGKVWRAFVWLPAHARHVQVDVKRAANQPCEVALALHDPDGHRIRPAQRSASRSKAVDALWQASGKEVQPGVWEVTVSAFATAPALSQFDVVVHATAATAEPVTLQAGADGTAKGTAQVRNLSERWLTLTARAELDRVQRSLEATSKPSASGTGLDRLELTVPAGGAFGQARVKLAVDVATWDKLTDLAITVRDAAGNVVAEDGFSSPTAEVSWPASATVQNYTVVLDAGFTGKAEAWKVTGEAALLARSPLRLAVQAAGPLVVQPLGKLSIALSATELPAAPKDYRWQGQLLLDDAGTRWLSLPLLTSAGQ